MIVYSPGGGVGGSDGLRIRDSVAALVDADAARVAFHDLVVDFRRLLQANGADQRGRRRRRRR